MPTEMTQSSHVYESSLTGKLYLFDLRVGQYPNQTEGYHEFNNVGGQLLLNYTYAPNQKGPGAMYSRYTNSEGKVDVRIEDKDYHGSRAYVEFNIDPSRAQSNSREEYNKLKGSLKKVPLHSVSKANFDKAVASYIKPQASQENSAPSNEKFPRYYGENRYETNRVVNEKLYKRAETAILVSGEVFPDTLSASNLARFYDAPLVLTGKDRLPGPSKELLNKLGVKNIIVVGGANTVSESLYKDLSRSYNMKRIAGQTRYETSQRVAEEARRNHKYDGHVFVEGESFQNAMSAVSYADENNLLLLLDPGTPAGKVYYSSRDDEKEKLIAQGTYKDINKTLLDLADAGKTAIASIECFPDALSAVSLAAKEDFGILLTDQVSDEEIRKNPNSVIVGGPHTIKYAEAGQISKILQELEGYRLMHSSGAGGWLTRGQMLKDGNFTGNYYHGNWRGDRTCDFKGKFEYLGPINDHAHKINLKELIITSNTGEKTVINGRPTEYIAETTGFTKGPYVLYTPGTPVSSLSADERSWIKYETYNKDSIDFYYIYNDKIERGTKIYK